MNRPVQVLVCAVWMLAQTSHTSCCADVDSPRPLSPQASLESMVLSAGFTIELVAAEPLVKDPIYLDWGADGKLWVVEMADYPAGVDGQGSPGGRIRVLEDTDGDGKFDKSTVFLDDLTYPSAVMVWRKGVLVSAAPDIFYAEDTDGDGRSDHRQLLYRGFTPGNPQHQVNGFCWGLDNWIHLANGDSGGAVTSLRTGRTVAIGGRDVRIRPDAGLLDPQTGRSQYGRSRDDWGNWFGTSNSQPIIHFVLADDRIRRNPHVITPPARMTIASSQNTVIFPIGRVISHFEGYQPPAPGEPHRFGSACSTIVYRDDLFGPEFVQNTFTCEPAHNLLQRRVLEPNGLTFTSRRAEGEERQEFLASTDSWFRPTTCRVGPDGALWIVDMYRLVIEHPDLIDDRLLQELDLRAGQDKGRIYRVYPAQQSPRKRTRLDQLDTLGLVGALGSQNGWTRDRAQQMLIWRQDRSAIPALRQMARGDQRAVARIHAFCTLDGLGALTPDVVTSGLVDSHPVVRCHALRLLDKLNEIPPDSAAAFLNCVDDDDPHVQLQCAYALGQWKDRRAGRALGQMAMRHAEAPYLLAGVMSSVSQQNLDQVLAEVFVGDSGRPRGQLVRQLLSVATAMGDDTVLIRVLGIISSCDGEEYQNWQLSALRDVLDSLQRRGITLANPPTSASSELESAFGRVFQMLDAARQIAVDRDADPLRRKIAIELLAHGNSPSDQITLLGSLLVAQTPLELQLSVVRTLGRWSDEQIPQVLVAGWKNHGHQVRREILDILMSRSEWRDALLGQLENGLVRAEDIDASRRYRLLSDKVPSFRKRAEQLLATTASNADRKQVLTAHQSVLGMPGDRQRGELVFKDKCASCHRVNNLGHAVGPDLMAMNRSPSALLTAILDPNRFVSARYKTYTALTTDGQQFVGVLSDEAGHKVTLLGLEGKRQTLLRSQLDSLTETGQSLMPEGIENELTDRDLADVIAYLAGVGPKQPAVANSQRISPDSDGTLILRAEGARVVGPHLRHDPVSRILNGWKSDDDRATWELTLPKDGIYAVFMDYAMTQTDGNRFVIDTDHTTQSGELSRTEPANRFDPMLLGRLFLASGDGQLTLRGAVGQHGLPITVRTIWLVPVDKVATNWRRQVVAGNTPRLERSTDDGVFELPAASSEIYGDGTVFEPRQGGLAFWSGENRASWTLEVKKRGTWFVFVDYACGRNPAGTSLTIDTEDSRLTRPIIGTGSWKRYRQRLLGTIRLEPGFNRLTLRSAGKTEDCLIDVRSISLVPSDDD